MTVVQRFGSSLALNVHFHTLTVDGVWSTQADGGWDFHPLPAPSDHDVARIARAVCRKVQRLAAHGKDDDEQPSLLGHLANASVQGLVATGPEKIARRAPAAFRYGPRDHVSHRRARLFGAASPNL